MSDAAPKEIDIDRIFREQGHIIDEALCEAVRRALRRHKRLGVPIAIWENGGVVLVPPEQIDVDPEGPIF